MQSKETALATVKQEVRLQEWTAQIEAQQASGLTGQQWCAENGINPIVMLNDLPAGQQVFLCLFAVSAVLAFKKMNLPEHFTNNQIMQ